MKTSRCSTLALVAVAVLVGAVNARAQAPATAGAAAAPITDASIEQMAWLVGCWERQGRAGALTTERWFAPKASSMFGIGTTIRGDTLRNYEMLLLRVAMGRMQYIAHLAGQAPTAFTATALDASQVRFENVKHDFPQEITYRRQGADSVIAVTAGPENGQRREISFAFRRVGCS
jgi:hypothetical protein